MCAQVTLYSDYMCACLALCVTPGVHLLCPAVTYGLVPCTSTCVSCVLLGQLGLLCVHLTFHAMHACTECMGGGVRCPLCVNVLLNLDPSCQLPCGDPL